MRRTKRTKRLVGKKPKVGLPPIEAKPLLVLQALMSILPRDEKRPKLMNTWKFKDEVYFHDMQYQSDGTVSGYIWKYEGENKAKKLSSFKIDVSGKIIKFMAATKQQREIAEKLGESDFNKLNNRK